MFTDQERTRFHYREISLPLAFKGQVLMHILTRTELQTRNPYSVKKATKAELHPIFWIIFLISQSRYNNEQAKRSTASSQSLSSKKDRLRLIKQKGWWPFPTALVILSLDPSILDPRAMHDLKAKESFHYVLPWPSRHSHLIKGKPLLSNSNVKIGGKKALLRQRCISYLSLKQNLEKGCQGTLRLMWT